MVEDGGIFTRCFFLGMKFQISYENELLLSSTRQCLPHSSSEICPIYMGSQCLSGIGQRLPMHRNAKDQVFEALVILLLLQVHCLSLKF